MAVLKDEIIKNEILGEAQKLFRQYGLKKTTMDEIAAACGKAKSTLYHYFKSKEDVFDSVISLEMINLRRHVKNKVEEFKGMEDKILTYTIEFHKEVINKANLYRIIRFEDMAESRIKTHFYKMLEYEKSYMVRMMEDGYDSGEFRDVDRDDIPWIAEMFLAAFYGMVKYVVEKDGELDEEKLIKTAYLFIPRIFK